VRGETIIISDGAGNGGGLDELGASADDGAKFHDENG